MACLKDESGDQSLPAVWLISDARNDAVLEETLRTLPAGSGFVFRHYHLGDGDRRARFAALLALCREAGHTVLLAGPAKLAESWGADGCYGAASQLGLRADLLRCATVHDEAEIVAANAGRADAVFLSPVFPTRTHPGAATLGPERFRQLAALSKAPVIALGGMDADRAAALGWPRWAAIDAFLR